MTSFYIDGAYRHLIEDCRADEDGDRTHIYSVEYIAGTECTGLHKARSGPDARSSAVLLPI